MSGLLQQSIESAAQQFTNSEHVLANFVAANPDCLLVATSSEIAKRTGVSAMTVTRFIQKIGFSNIYEAKRALRDESLGPRNARFSRRFAEGEKHLETNEAYEAECFAIKRAYAMRESEDWKLAVDLVANSEAVFAAGMQSVSHLATALVSQLSYIRPNVTLVTGANGVYIAPLTCPSKHKTLIIIDIFRYGKDGPILARFAREKGVKVIVICDETCGWAQPCADIVFPVAIDLGLFLSSTVSIYSLVNLMLHDVADQLGAKLQEVLETTSEAQERFQNFLS